MFLTIIIPIPLLGMTLPNRIIFLLFCVHLTQNNEKQLCAKFSIILIKNFQILGVITKPLLKLCLSLTSGVIACINNMNLFKQQLRQLTRQ